MNGERGLCSGERGKHRWGRSWDLQQRHGQSGPAARRDRRRHGLRGKLSSRVRPEGLIIGQCDDHQLGSKFPLARQLGCSFVDLMV